MLYGWKQGAKHKWFADRKQTTIWNFAKPRKNSDHPTSKPLDLLAYPIRNSTQANAIILDTFAGSGSTLMAAEQTDRIAYCMELDEKYASVILRRYAEGDRGRGRDHLPARRHPVHVPGSGQTGRSRPRIKPRNCRDNRGVKIGR